MTDQSATVGFIGATTTPTKPSIMDYFHSEVSAADRFAGVLMQMEKDEADWPFYIPEGVPTDPAGLAAYLGGAVVPEEEPPAAEPEVVEAAPGTVTWPDGSVNDAANLPPPPPPDGGEGNSTVVGGSQL